MPEQLWLDGLFPPSPQQLVADCQAVGASGCFAYVWRPGGVGTWTPAHVAALRAAGLGSIPIIVPPPAPAQVPPAVLLAVAQAFGFNAGPITLDLEPPNLPAAGWEEQFDAVARARGFRDLDYGTPANLGLYQPDDADWKAAWIRTGVLQPLPALPPGWSAWQFVNDVVVAHADGSTSQYDASIVNLEETMTLDPNDPIVQELRSELKAVWQAATATDAAKDDAGNPIPDHWAIGYILGHVRQIQATPQQPVDAAALAAQLEPILAAALIPNLPPSVDAAVVARDVVVALAAQLSKP